MNITDIKGSGIFDLEENKVDTIGDNLPPWLEVEEALEELNFQGEENMPLL